MLTLCDSEEGVLAPHFCFKGPGTILQKKLNRPEGVISVWAPKGSYRLEQMLESIEALPDCSTRDALLGQTFKDYKIALLDDYSVHVQPEVSRCLCFTLINKLIKKEMDG